MYYDGVLWVCTTWRFSWMTRVYYKESQGCIIMLDLTRFHLTRQYSEILIPLKSLEEGVDLVFQLFYKDWSSVKPIDNSSLWLNPFIYALILISQAALLHAMSCLWRKFIFMYMSLFCQQIF